MLVMKIVLGLMVLFYLYKGIVAIDEYASRKYRYAFFTKENFVIAFVGNLLIYFGYQWYEDALKNAGDISNGSLLVLFGVVTLLFLIYRNIKESSFVLGFSVSLLQLILFGAVSVFAFIALILFIASFFNPRPYYGWDDDYYDDEY